MENYGLHVEIPRKSGIIKETPLTAMAFFVAPPQCWKMSLWDTNIINKFTTSLSECPNLSSDKIVVHGCYLINPASIKEEVRLKSQKRFLEEVKLCDILGVGNYVFHPGSNKDTQQSLQYTVDLINIGLNETKNVNILVENMTQTNSLCQTWQEIEWVINHLNNSRVGCCLDTAHCWGAGPKKGMFMDTLLNDYDNIVGINTLKAIHLNDSKVEYGSNLDRHEDILKGKIPFNFWDSFIFDKRVRTIPAILETPSNCHSIITEIIKNKGIHSLENKMSSKEKPCFCSKSSDSLETSDTSDSSDSSDSSKSSDSLETSDTSDSSDTSKSSDSLETSDTSDSSKTLESSDSSNIININKENISFNHLELLFTNEWKDILKTETNKEYFKKIKYFLNEKKVKIYPPINKIFEVFNRCPPQNIKVVIVGQDCYFKEGQAEGLSFSVPIGIKIPSSLRNIYKELCSDIKDFIIPKHGHLGHWVDQGVFLLNSSLTVENGKAGSHLKIGWQEFTDFILTYINDNCENIVFILWGEFAKKKRKYIEKKHYVLEAPHPSGLSAYKGFFGCNHFSKCNNYLEKKNKIKIIW